MKILLSAGHGGTDSGSIGADKGKERDRTIYLANKVATLLKNSGHTVTVNSEKTATGSWRFKNRNGYDYALSIHFNAFNGNATGTEVLYKGTTKKANELSKAVSNILGITNRGAKSRTDLYMMNIGFDNLIEVCFHDNKSDLEKYNVNIDKVAIAIATVINGGTPTPTPKPSPSKPTVTGDIKYQTYDNVKKQWLPEVINDKDYAGNFGHSIGGIRTKCKNGSIYMQTHTKNGKWLSSIKSNTYSKGSNNGNTYSGIIGKDIDGVKVWSDYGYVEYRVHLKDGKWLAWVNSKDVNGTGANSYAGIYGKEIDAIQMK